MMVFILMGACTSIDSMPEWAQVMPAQSGVILYRGDADGSHEGQHHSRYRPSFCHHRGMAVFFNVWAIVNYRKGSELVAGSWSLVGLLVLVWVISFGSWFISFSLPGHREGHPPIIPITIGFTLCQKAPTIWSGLYILFQ